jgi:exodeoxyribonuclease V beta subunit
MSAPAFDPRGAALDGVQLIEASAGTGKTWTICALVLRLLVERRLTVDRILVVTFTNAATAELRERVRGRIAELRDHLRDGAPADELVGAVAERARALWDTPAALVAHLDLALHGFDEAAISTIHGFCQRALTGAPFTARVAASLELLDDDGELRRGVVHDFWRTHVAGADVQLATLMRGLKDTPERFDALLARRVGQPLARHVWPEGLDAPDDDHGPAIAVAHARARALWLAQRAEVLAVIEAAVAAKALHGGTYKPAGVAEAVADWDRLLAADAPALAAAAEGRAALLAASRLAEKTNKKATPPAHAFFDAAEALLAARAAAGAALRRARLRLLRRLLDEGPALLRERKRALRAVAFDDLLSDLWQRLVGAPLPGYAQALRAHYPAMLIDEFQDTDPQQYAIFSALHGADPAAGPLFLVGDPKQAIYRFRHADLHAYLAARRGAGAVHTLLGNQRSDALLIDALNVLFTANPRVFLLDGLDYPVVRPGAKPRKAFVDASGSPAQPLQLWTLPHGDDGQPLPKPEARRQAVAATAAEVARLLAAGRRGEVTIAGRPLEGGDIAVLVRTHRDGRQVRAALGAAGVASVEHAQDSVLASPEAEELERVLAAVLEPERWALVRGALATSLLAVDAAALLAIDEASDAAAALRGRLEALRDLWRERGVAMLLRRWLREEGVSTRLLARPDGERRMTNLLHLAELLHRASEDHPGMEPLLRWLQVERRAAAQGGGGEERQLRLESDRHLVQIVTVHKSKGLEYPIVFCPLLWDGGRRPEAALPGIALHDARGASVVDFRAEAGDGFDDAAPKAAVAAEVEAEAMRLLYVALTRAEHRCVLVAGGYTSRGTASECLDAALNRLTGGRADDPAGLLARWAGLAASSPQAIAIATLAQPGRAHSREESAAGARIVARSAPRVPPAWRIASFSSLNAGTAIERASADRDLHVAVTAPGTAPPPDLADDDILRFPRGPLAGEVLHALLERVDFTDPSGWPASAASLVRERCSALGVAPTAQAGLVAQMVRMLGDVLATELRSPSGRCFRLAQVPWARRLVENEFHLGREAAGALGVPAGYLTGFIDLVFEHAGELFIVDWKSNHLGWFPQDYDADRLAMVVREQGYDRQAAIYARAVESLCARRPGVRFGGAFCVFLRGTRPAWLDRPGTSPGVNWFTVGNPGIGPISK